MQAHPILYQLNTRVYLTELSTKLSRKATLEDIPDAFIEQLAIRGVEILWLLSVWTTGPRSQQESRRNPDWLHEFSRVLGDLQADDIGGSGFAIADYQVAEHLGGPEALASFRKRLAKHGMRLMLDFVPNHVGLDHAWAVSHPEYIVQGTEVLLAEQPLNYVRDSRTGHIFAHGRDPYFAGWSDTLQLDYSNSDLQEQMHKTLLNIARECDAVRCDMAMLLTPRVFKRTWGRSIQSFWGPAIHRVKAQYPGFVFMAEVYWDMEWELQEEGFDYCYDKRLYDRLRDRDYLGVRNHLRADLAYQSKLARFMENHDEPRAASTFRYAQHLPAALVSYLSPGLKFFHHGQWEGAKIKVSPHLIRGPHEEPDTQIQHWYRKLTDMLKDPIFHQGDWELLEVQRAWADNWSSDCLIAWLWKEKSSNTSLPGRVVLCIANMADHDAQGRIEIPEWLRSCSGHKWRNLWTETPFDMPADQWDSGWWTLYAHGAQVFVVANG